MFALFRGEGVQNEDVYVDLVKHEGHAFSILIVRDLVYLAVKGGKIFFCVIANQLSNVYLIDLASQYNVTIIIAQTSTSGENNCQKNMSKKITYEILSRITYRMTFSLQILN